MSKVNLKNNIWIEGFEDDFKRYERTIELFKESKIQDPWKQDEYILYKGKTSEISEELAKRIIPFMFWDKKSDKDRPRFKTYKPTVVSYEFLDYKESIQSACPEEYCIIYYRN